MAAAVDATLTLVHITAGVEIWGPGGSVVDEGVATDKPIFESSSTSCGPTSGDSVKLER
jgi:hypothetical protein